MTNLKWLASLVLATTVIPALLAETHCPGNVESLPFRLVNRYQMIVAVSVNHTGPYNFLLDTGTQITMLDPSLAAELRLNTEGSAGVNGAGFHASASFAQLDSLDAGSHVIANPRVLVFDLQKLRSVDLAIRGILGEDFLEHFDMLVDNAHSLLCLDDTAVIRAALKGTHAALLPPAQVQSGLPSSLVIEVRLSDGMRPVRLMLDSGSNAPVLFNTSQYMALGLVHGASWHGSSADGTQRAFVALPLQDVRIGSLQLPKVPFFTLGAHKDSRKSDFDGLLTLGLFRRVFINHAEHYVVFDPW
jgi:predicted aspartyl protease